MLSRPGSTSGIEEFEDMEAIEGAEAIDGVEDIEGSDVVDVIGGICISLIAVSYTHLDVYKRQP